MVTYLVAAAQRHVFPRVFVENPLVTIASWNYERNHFCNKITLATTLLDLSGFKL